MANSFTPCTLVVDGPSPRSGDWLFSRVRGPSVPSLPSETGPGRWGGRGLPGSWANVGGGSVLGPASSQVLLHAELVALGIGHYGEVVSDPQDGGAQPGQAGDLIGDRPRRP